MLADASTDCPREFAWKAAGERLVWEQIVGGEVPGRPEVLSGNCAVEVLQLRERPAGVDERFAQVVALTTPSQSLVGPSVFSQVRRWVHDPKVLLASIRGNDGNQTADQLSDVLAVRVMVAACAASAG